MGMLVVLVGVEEDCYKGVSVCVLVRETEVCEGVCVCERERGAVSEGVCACVCVW